MIIELPIDAVELAFFIEVPYLWLVLEDVGSQEAHYRIRHWVVSRGEDDDICFCFCPIAEYYLVGFKLGDFDGWLYLDTTVDNPFCAAYVDQNPPSLV